MENYASFLSDVEGEKDKLYWKVRRLFKNQLNISRKWSELKRAYRRAVRRWDGTEHWSLDSHIIRDLSRGTKDLMNNLHGHPVAMTEQEWRDILNEIHELSTWLENNQYEFPDGDEWEAKSDRLFDLLKKHFWSLWD